MTHKQLDDLLREMQPAIVRDYWTKAQRVLDHITWMQMISTQQVLRIRELEQLQ